MFKSYPSHAFSIQLTRLADSVAVAHLHTCHWSIHVALLDYEKARRWAVWRVSPALCRPNGSRCSGRAAAACVDISSLFVAAGSWVAWGYRDHHEVTILHAATPGVTYDAHTETAAYF